LRRSGAELFFDCTGRSQPIDLMPQMIPEHPAIPGVPPPDRGALLRHAPLWLLALFTFSGTLAMHIFVPALPYAAESLHVGAGTMQLTVSLYIAGLALGQLVYGPVSDRFGRRPTLMIGLALYTVAGLGAALAPDAGSLIAARLFQALGGCAGLVLGRAIVRDTATTQEAARRLALMNLMVTIGPGVAPLLGAALAATFGWRSIFYALTALGVVNLVFTWRLLPETGGVDARANTSVGALARHYGQLLRSPAFLGYSIGGGCATTAMYAFIASAPFIFVHQLHRPAHEVGFYLAALVSGVWLGSVLASRLIRFVALRKLLVRANALSVLGALILLGAVVSGHLGVVVVVVPMFMFTLGAGIASPAALTEAISVNPLVTGSASGLYGFTQMAVGALCTALAGLGDDPALAAAIVLVAAGGVGQLSFWIAARRRPAG
jgi:DHA1 family bicyclomycin/chloramphenicol resistance-like MFS transporter